MKKYYSASDVEKYAYCPLSWWLRKNKKEVKNKEEKAGIVKHEKFNKAINEVIADEEKSISLEQLVVIYSLGGTLVALIGVILYSLSRTIDIVYYMLATISLLWFFADSYLWYISLKNKNTKKDENYILLFGYIGSIFGLASLLLFLQLKKVFGEILSVIAVLWIVAAIFAFYYSLHLKIEAIRLRKEYTIQEGKIVYNDNMKHSYLFLSEQYKLSGRPDYILYHDGKYIPVEVKTGKTPPYPLYSHIAQLMVYNILVEEHFKVRPDYGILEYNGKSFPVMYTEHWKHRILNYIKKMEIIEQTGIAHRNHNKVSKCLHCSQYSICPERLGDKHEDLHRNNRI